MRILLIKPPLNPRIITTAVYEPLELEYLGASVSNHDVRIIDMRIDNGLTKTLNEFKPHLTGITAYTTDYSNAVRILTLIRNFDKSIVTVVGGHHATFMPSDFFLPQVDVIFRGYADNSFPDYVNSIYNPEKIKQIQGLILLKDGIPGYISDVSQQYDVENIPFPDRELTGRYRMKYHDPVRNRLSLLMSSRGCPFRCNFCACWKLMNGSYSARTPASIIEELKSLDKHIDIVYFSDDNTFHDIGRMKELGRLIRENGIRKKLQMYARADTIVKHPELFHEMKLAGLQFLTVGFESFTDSDLDYYNKKTNVTINEKAIRILKEAGIYIISHFIVRPGYTKKDFDDLLYYVFRHNLFRPAFPVLTPLPGTELWDQEKDSFELREYEYFDFAHSVLPTVLDRKEFHRLLSEMYLRSFSPKRLIKHRFNRFLAIRPDLYYTDNTDGLSLIKLIRTDAHALIAYIKMKSFRN